MFAIVQKLYARQNLIRELVLKDLKLRYSRPILGIFWAFLSPFLIVLILYVIFSLVLKVKTEEAPFFLYLMSAVFPWRFFQDSVMSSVTSLVDNKNLIRESNFPHYLIPVSIVLTNAVIFLPSLLILIVISAFVLKGLPIYTLFLPVILAVHFAMTIGLSTMLSILYVKWRDIKYILEPALLLLFYLTPVFYSIYLVKSSFSALLFKAYIYNPFVGILNLYRFSLLKGFYSLVQKDIGFLGLIVMPSCFAILFLLLGFYFYSKNKDKINDYLPY